MTRLAESTRVPCGCGFTHLLSTSIQFMLTSIFAWKRIQSDTPHVAGPFEMQHQVPGKTRSFDFGIRGWTCAEILSRLASSLSKTIQNPPAKKSRRQGQRPSVNLSISCSSYFIIFHSHQTMDLKSQNIQKSDAKVVAAKLTATIPPTQTQVSCIRSFFIPVKSHELCEHVMTLCCARPIEP